MEGQKIHIDEENTHLFWGLISIVTIAAATYMLTNAFMAGSWSIAGYTQIISLAFFSIGFFGIIRISSPLFHFVLSVSEDILTIEIWQEGDHPLDVKEIALSSIKELRITPHKPRRPNEALFDFSTGYYLLYRDEDTQNFKRLIDLDGEAFTLKVDDIGKIMAFLHSNNPDIYVPESDAVFVEANN